MENVNNTAKQTRFAVICAPGYGDRRDNKLPVFSSHRTEASALKAAGRDRSVCVVEANEPKGSFIWADAFRYYRLISW